MYDIKYSIVKMDIRFKDNSKMNINKQSAIRGIIGNTLIDDNCLMSINDRKCEDCFFNSRCISYNIFSPKIKSSSVGEIEENISPFIIICDDKREFIKKGEDITFAMIFFGDTIAFIPTIIRAVKKAGETLGLEGNLFELTKAANDKGEIIYNNDKFSFERINIRKINEYIENRLSISPDIERIEIISPIRFKKNKRFHNNLEEEDLINLIKRRLITLAGLEKKEMDFNKEFYFKIKEKSLSWAEFNRYSNRQKSRMSLGGITGYIELEEVSEETKKLLIAGELIHIGKSTSFGLGDYILY